MTDQTAQPGPAPSPPPGSAAVDAPPPPPPGVETAPRGSSVCSRGAWAALLISALLALVADLGSKWLAFHTIAGQPVEITRERVMQAAAHNIREVSTIIPPHQPVTVVPKLLQLTLVLNPGAVFGMGPGQRWFFVAFTAVALTFGLWMFARWTRPGDRLAHIGIGLLLGGGLGNLYDRLTIGVVRDFLHPLPGARWPYGWRLTGPTGEIWPYVSNIADLLLLIGIGMLLIYLWRRDKSLRETA